MTRHETYEKLRTREAIAAMAVARGLSGVWNDGARQLDRHEIDALADLVTEFDQAQDAVMAHLDACMAEAKRFSQRDADRGPSPGAGPLWGGDVVQG